MKFIYEEGATPYNLDDAIHLLPKQITTQKELNEWEQNNIILAERWLFTKRRKNIFSIEFIKSLHKKMFNLTWLWAGQLRTYQTNIGVSPYQISQNLKMLCDDVQYWISHKSFSSTEIATRFHHKLVYIHPFPNGNGRHSRLMTDALLVSLNIPRFSWGNGKFESNIEMRKAYINALKLADIGDYSPLLTFLELPNSPNIIRF